jgi:23S rRNA pseudouridine1911/1915/1917 synthase
MPRHLRITIADNPPPRLDKALARDVPEEAGLSRSQIARLIAAGAVTRSGTVLRDAKARVAQGDLIEIVVPDPAIQDLAPEPIPLAVVHEDEHLLVVDKLAGMVVHPAPGTRNGTLVNALLHRFGAGLAGSDPVRPGIVHRIDKDTSGLLVVAKTDRAHQGLAEQFAAHTVHRRYRALVHGVPDPGDPRLLGTRGVSVRGGGEIVIQSGLARHRTDRQRQAVYFDGKGKRALTRLWVSECYGSPNCLALVTCALETGRTHQIRVHLAHAGHALVGDPVYGGRRRVPVASLPADVRAQVASFDRQALHAAELGFVHPVTDVALAFEAPMPADMARLLAALGSESRPDRDS